MPLLLASPFDRTLDPAHAEPTPPQPVPEPALAPLPPDVVRKIGPRQDLADLWFILVKAGAWLGAIYLMVLGLPLMVLLALAGGNLDLVFLQLGNLAAHYQSADPVSRVAFNRGLALTLFGLATLTTIWRLPAFLERVDTDLSGAKTVRNILATSSTPRSALRSTLATAALAVSIIGFSLWGIWATRTLLALEKRQVVTVQLSKIMGDFVEAEARSGRPAEQTRGEVEAYLKAVQASVDRLGRDGRTVLVAEAVVAGGVPDMTDKVRADVAAHMGRPAHAAH